MAAIKGRPGKLDTTKMSKAAARRVLTTDDRKALPFLNKKDNDPNSPTYGKWYEDIIVSYVIERLKLSNLERMNRVQRMQEIDIQLSGVVNLSKDDKRRDKENKRGYAPKPTKHNIPLAYSQIDDCVTYCMSLFAPEMNMFVATSNAKNQSVAEGLTREIGKHGQTLQYYRQVSKFVQNSLKYNLGSLGCRWEKNEGIIYAPDTQNTATGAVTPQSGTVWEGNVVKSLDMYNFFYDTSVHPVDLPLRGEFFAEVEMVTPFRVRRMQEQKILFGVERFANTVAPIASNNGVTFYVRPPSVRENWAEASSVTTPNWRNVWQTNSTAKDSALGIELAWYTGWVKPSALGLSTSDTLELWQICIANGAFVSSAYKIDVTHGQLPCACAAPIEDDLRNDQRTYAEMLLPLQHFASFLLNTHVEATRKAIYGITVFDKGAFPGLDLSTDELIGMRIPMKSNSSGIDIDKMFRHYNEAPQTDQNVDMVEKIVALMQKILPTNQAQQVADLERATEYQAAATVQASSRRNLKIARMINDQGLTPIKFQMLYNIYQNLTVITYVDPISGQEKTITPADLVEAQIEFDVGTGLKGLDRLMQVSIFKELMGYLFQVKDIGQQVDLLALLSYVTQIAGFETDLSQFKLQPQQPAVDQNGNPLPQNAQTPVPPAAAPAPA